MPPQPTLRIVEVFPSLQGEGLRQGEPTIFIRLAGCNLKCSFCDTKYAWRGGTDLSISDIMAKVETIRRRFPVRWVCLTGGEPFLQDLRPLVRLLKKEKLKIQVETNGTLYYRLSADWFSISPKPKSYSFRPEFRTLADEVKLVVSKELTAKIIARMRAAFPPNVPILLQPQSQRRWSQERAVRFFQKACSAGLDNIRVSIQLHKILKLR
jgi:7-carboxy-7-deazaguanine synthase